MRAIGICVAMLCVGVGALGLGASADSKPKHRGLGPYPGLGGCPLFPAPPKSTPANASSLPSQAAWRQDISQAPLDENSGDYIDYIDAHGADHLHPDFGSPRAYGFPYAVVGRHARKVPIHYTAYGDQSDKGPYRVPGSSPVEGGRHSNDDRHVLVIDRARCRLYELYRGFFRHKPKRHWNAASATNWNLRSKRLRPPGWTSADAAGLPIFPGLVRLDEVRRGVIRHAIRVTFESTRDAWIEPATHCAGDTSDADAPPMGLRLRLEAGYNISGFNRTAKVIAVAMKRYGLIVADNGSNWYFSGTSDRRWPDAKLDQLKSIPGDAFEVVQSAATVHTCK